MISNLEKTPLFHQILPEEISGMLSCLGAQEQFYQRGEFLFLAGESIPKVGLLISGSAQIIRETESGDRMVIKNLKEGEIFGGIYASVGMETMPVSVYAVGNCRALLFSLNKVVHSCANACPHHHQLIFNLLRIFANQNLLLNLQLSYMSHKTIRKRLIAYLKDQAEKKGGGSFRLPMNKSQLAEYLCIDRSAMQRELSRMEEVGLIQINGKLFQINSDVIF